MEGMSVLILGASGLTGSYLLSELLELNEIQSVTALVRSPLGRDHPKLTVVQADLFDLESVEDRFQVDVVYCCIGTTAAKTPDKTIYRKIDMGITVEAARLASKHGVKQFMVISSMGANPNSKVFYNRLKGEMEEAVLALDIPKIHILRPSLIGGDRLEKRRGEKLALRLMKTFKAVVPANYRIIHPRTIAHAMIKLTLNPVDKTIFLSTEIKELSQDES